MSFFAISFAISFGNQPIKRLNGCQLVGGRQMRVLIDMRKPRWAKTSWTSLRLRPCWISRNAVVCRRSWIVSPAVVYER